MVFSQQVQHYSFLEEKRKKALAQQSLAQQYYAILKQAIPYGIHPKDDPDLSAKWYYLVGEYGDKYMNELYESEIAMHLLKLEDESQKEKEGGKW